MLGWGEKQSSTSRVGEKQTLGLAEMHIQGSAMDNYNGEASRTMPRALHKDVFAA